VVQGRGTSIECLNKPAACKIVDQQAAQAVPGTVENPQSIRLIFPDRAAFLGGASDFFRWND